MTEAQILEETKRIQYLYSLKHEIRYGESRTDMGESVAEHIFGMHIIAEYFMELENPEKTWNREDIYQMITWHDIDEVETGDTIGFKKTAEQRAQEVEILSVVIEKSPEILKERILDILRLYHEQETIEARFVKAIDRIEPVFQLYNENGKQIQLRNNTTNKNSQSLKEAYVEAFPYMKQFNTVLHGKMVEEGFFSKDA